MQKVKIYNNSEHKSIKAAKKVKYFDWMTYLDSNDKIIAIQKIKQ